MKAKYLAAFMLALLCVRTPAALALDFSGLGAMTISNYSFSPSLLLVLAWVSGWEPWLR